MLLGVAFALLLLMSAGLTIALVVGVGGFLWDQHPWVLASLALAGSLAAAIVLRRPRRSGASPAQAGPAVHPGITMHSIPVSGGMGLVFTLGYLAMFLFALPGVGPVVLAVAAVGALFGGLLVVVKAHRSKVERDSRVLPL